MTDGASGSRSLVLVIGPPAAGKTTLLPHAERILREVTGKMALALPTDWILKVQCPPSPDGGDSTREFGYWYEGDQLVFAPHRRLELTRRAIVGTFAAASLLSAKLDAAWCAVEIPGLDPEAALDVLGASAFAGRICLLLLNAPLAVRAERNLNRQDWLRLPESAMEFFSSCRVDWRQMLTPRLAERVDALVVVDTEPPLDVTIARLEKALRQLVETWENYG